MRAVFSTELYSEEVSFLLPFIQVQEWLVRRKYKEGVHFAVLGHKIHPFYGVYAPSRTDHLELISELGSVSTKALVKQPLISEPVAVYWH